MVRTIFGAILLSIAKLLTPLFRLFGRYLHASAHPKYIAVCFQFPMIANILRHFSVAGFVTGYRIPQLGRNLMLLIIISERNSFNSYKTFGVAPSLGLLLAQNKAIFMTPRTHRMQTGTRRCANCCAVDPNQIHFDLLSLLQSVQQRPKRPFSRTCLNRV